MGSLKITGALLCTLIFWASAFVGIRIALVDYSPGALALLRFLVASFCILVIYARLPNKRNMPLQTKMELLLIGMAGIGVYNITLNMGEVTVSAGVASFIVGLMPVLAIILSVLFLKERPGAAVWAGVVVSFAGLLLMMCGDKSRVAPGSGELIILISALMGAFYNVTQKRYLRHYHPVEITAWVMWGGTLFLMWFLPELNRDFFVAGWKTTLVIVYLGVFPGALAYAAWCYTLDHFPVSKASMYLYYLPVISTLMGYLLLHELPSLLSLVGGLLALFGAMMATRLPYFILSRSRVSS